MNAKTLMLFASVLSGVCLQAAYQDPPPAPIVQFRPDGQRNLTTVDTELAKQMGNVDQQIQQLATQRDELRAKIESVAQEAKILMEQYQNAVDLQQQYQQKMQAIDDNIVQLVRKKTDLSNQRKK